MKNQPQPLYNKEIGCYLPANSEIPQAPQQAIAPAALSALVEVIRASEQLQQQIEGRLVPMRWLSDGFAHLGALTAHAHHLFAEEMLRSEGEVKNEIKWPAGQEGVAEEALIERVFNITRLAPMSWLQWATQLAESCTHLVSDLSFAVLNIDEMAAMLVAVKSIFTRLAQDLASQPAAPTHPPQPWEGLRGGGDPLASQAVLTFWGLHQDRIQRWQTFPDLAADAQRVEAWQAWEKQVVFYRWFVGHHFFFLCSIYCHDYLRQATLAFEQDEVECASERLAIAARFLRASTAAMWYTSHFPACLYQNQVRPYLVEVGPPSGASGSLISDYKLVLLAKEALHQLLLCRYGNNTRRWPARVRQSVQYFHEVYVEDMEQHTLLAASKVGLDSSLTQKVWQADLPERYAVGNALDILRNMTGLRKAELKF